MTYLFNIEYFGVLTGGYSVTVTPLKIIYVDMSKSREPIFSLFRSS